MNQPEFQGFPKMGRLSRECVITEKIDGTNAQLLIVEDVGQSGAINVWYDSVTGKTLLMFAGSRNRWLQLGDDNYGFAKWVAEQCAELKKLPVGRHFGEWWGSGIQRGYGLPKGEKRLSLFNTERFHLHGTPAQRKETENPLVWKETIELPPCVGLVPVLDRGPFDTYDVERCIDALVEYGSYAAPGFMDPEGVIVWHTAAQVGFKKTIENVDKPKSKA
jgi:hypothetical protein